jgi:hypothetical protein
MPRQLPAAYWTGSTLSASDEDFLVLCSITHASIEPVYLVSDVVDVTSNGINYIGFPFELVLPQEDDQIPKGRLRIQNVDKRIGHAIHTLRTPPFLNFRVVLKSDPDEVLVEYKFLRLTNISADAVAVEGDIGVTDFSSIPWPRTRATKRVLPGLFRVYAT